MKNAGKWIIVAAGEQLNPAFADALGVAQVSQDERKLLAYDVAGIAGRAGPYACNQVWPSDLATARYVCATPGSQIDVGLIEIFRPDSQVKVRPAPIVNVEMFRDGGYK